MDGSGAYQRQEKQKKGIVWGCRDGLQPKNIEMVCPLKIKNTGWDVNE
jgi:hypothetical protein